MARIPNIKIRAIFVLFALSAFSNFLSITVTAHKFIHAPCGIHQFLLAGVKWVRSI
jgi:hypothetical protein